MRGGKNTQKPIINSRRVCAKFSKHLLLNVDIYLYMYKNLPGALLFSKRTSFLFISLDLIFLFLFSFLFYLSFLCFYILISIRFEIHIKWYVFAAPWICIALKEYRCCVIPLSVYVQVHVCASSLCVYTSFGKH